MIVINIFKLFGSVFVDTEKAEESISKTEKQAGGLGKKLGSVIGTAAKFGAGLAAGAGIAAAGLAGLLNKTLETTAEISKFAQVTGMSTKGFQEWDYVAKQFGFSMEQASGDMAALAERALDATSGVGENAEIFKELGVNVQGANGQLKSQEQLFNEVIAGLQGMEDVTKRNAYATMLLSTTGEELAPVLNMTTAELQKMKANANVIADEDIQKAEKFRQGFENVKATFSTVITEIGIKFLPILQKMMDWVTDKLPSIQKFFDDVFSGSGDSLKIFADVWTWLKNNIIKPYLDFVVPFIQEKLAAIKKYWSENGDGIMKTVKTVFNLIRDIINEVMPIVKSVVETTWNTIGVVISSVIDIISGVIKILDGIFRGNWQSVWDGFEQVVSGVMDGVIGIVKGAINLIIGQINRMISGLNKIKVDVPDWVADLTGIDSSFSLNIPKIPMLADGGHILDDGAFIAGEAGAELITGAKGATVTPLTPSENPQSISTQPEYIQTNVYLDGRKIAEAQSRPLGDLTSRRQRGQGFA